MRLSHLTDIDEKRISPGRNQARKGIAIYCDGDTRAHRVILGLQQNGVRVPEDVVVAGFDALEYEDCVPFPSIKFSGYRIGYFATCLLDMMVDHEDLVSYSIVIDGELVRVEHVPEVVR
jgi:DNA-binding LacI/PurR family transcriptional regulator